MPEEQRRRLVLLRHAKTRDGEPDHERRLTPRGERDAAAAGSWLHGLGGIDLALVSSAARARRTWELAAAELDPGVEVRVEPAIYLASTDDLLGLVHGTGPDVGTLLLVGHNPGMHDLAWTLADRHGLLEAIGGLPTSGIAVLELPGPWAEAGPGRCTLVDAVAPRG